MATSLLMRGLHLKRFTTEKRTHHQPYRLRITRRCVVAVTICIFITSTLLYVGVHNSTPALCQASIDIAVVLKHQRQVIAAEMEAANVTSDWSTQHLLNNGGEPIRNVIVTTWRSGSTFFNEILNNQPGNFDHYEPFHPFGGVNVDLSSDHHASQVLRNILNCDYSLHSRPLYDTVLFNVNKNLNGLLPKNCFFREMIEPICRLFPHQSMKLIRVRLRHLDAVMREFKNVRVFFLVRDPRASMSSRRRVDWCVTPTCYDAASVCADLVDDYRAALTLASAHPTRFRVVRYEDLAADPSAVIKELFLATGLVYDERVESFLSAHTRTNEEGIYNTHRNSSQSRFKWREAMDYEEVERIQQVCSVAMSSWGYLSATSAEQLRTFLPVREWRLY